MARAQAILTGAALATASALALVACGGSGDGGTRFGDFTDCSTIGRVTTVRDAAHDQSGQLAGVPPEPQGDLLQIAVARAHGRLCVEYRVRGPVKPTVAYELVLRPPRTETPVATLQATVFSAEEPRALLNPGGPGADLHPVAAKVGIHDDRLSVLVDRSQFARLGAGSMFDAFRFQARSAVVTKDGGHLTDCAPAC